MIKVNWFEKESEQHKYGQPGERKFAAGQVADALILVEELRGRDDVIHVQYENKVSPRRGDVIEQGWVRDDAGYWREQYVMRYGESYEFH